MTVLWEAAAGVVHLLHRDLLSEESLELNLHLGSNLIEHALILTLCHALFEASDLYPHLAIVTRTDVEAV